MRRLFFVLVTLFWVGLAGESMAQFNRKAIKKGNTRIASFRGSKASFRSKVYNSIGFSVNALNYYGDLAPAPKRFSTDISFTRPGFAFLVTHRFGPRYSLMGQFMFGTLRGADAESAKPDDLDNGIYRYQRNLSFRNQIKELSVVAVFDLFENTGTYMSRVRWTPYVFLGVAGFISNPQGKAPATDLNGNPLPEAGEWVNLRKLGTEGQYADLPTTAANHGIKPYKAVQVAIPFGIGARFKVNEVFDIAADLSFRYTFTDYLDDVSQNFVDLTELNSELARAMSYRSSELPEVQQKIAQGNSFSYGGYTVLPGYGHEHPDNVRGNKDDRDIYMVTSVRLTYVLGNMHRAKFR
ncbi:MAG: DUF6089 family protein [Cyclobacteriaceae bacterium]|jgi:hypothetical protein